MLFLSFLVQKIIHVKMLCELWITISYGVARAFSVRAIWQQLWADTNLFLGSKRVQLLMKQLPTKADRTQCFSISLFIPTPLEKKYVIKMCWMMSSSCYFSPNSALFLLFSGLAKSQSTHFPCYGFGTNH